jgi:glucosylceramidase
MIRGFSFMPSSRRRPQSPKIHFDVDVWLTSPDQTALCARQPESLRAGPTPRGCRTIKVNAAKQYQIMDGFGFALTGGSADLIQQLPFKQKILQELFSTRGDGIKLALLRISIGASDLGHTSFTYDDLPQGQTDLDLNQFRIRAGDASVIPLLRDIVAINPAIKIIATPWSAPAWMKSNQNLVGGALRRDFYDVYAAYLVMYIKQMNDNGIPIYAITPQNEPLNANNDPSMQMSAVEQSIFIRDHLGPRLRDSSLGHVKVFCYDHNCDHPEYPTTVLHDVETRQFISGVAWHLYVNKPRALSNVSKKYPGLKTYLTEYWVGANEAFAEVLDWHAHHLLIGTIRNGAQAVLEWNLAADPNHEPHTPGGCTKCVGALTISGSSIVRRNVSYYIVAHLSRFVPPNSARISSTAIASLPNVAFATPDGKAVLLVLNGSDEPQTFGIQYNDRIATAVLDKGVVATYVWQLDASAAIA